jgi:hypothetical protein
MAGSVGISSSGIALVPDLACRHLGSLGCRRLPPLPELDQIRARALSDRFGLPASPTAA